MLLQWRYISFDMFSCDEYLFVLLHIRYNTFTRIPIRMCITHLCSVGVSHRMGVLCGMVCAAYTNLLVDIWLCIWILLDHGSSEIPPTALR